MIQVLPTYQHWSFTNVLHVYNAAILWIMQIPFSFLIQGPKKMTNPPARSPAHLPACLACQPTSFLTSQLPTKPTRLYVIPCCRPACLCQIRRITRFRVWRMASIRQTAQTASSRAGLPSLPGSSKYLGMYISWYLDGLG